MNLLDYSLAELIELQKSWNPGWHDTGIWSLIAPFLKYLDDGTSATGICYTLLSVLIIPQKYLIEQWRQRIH